MKAVRLPQNPIISPATHPGIGDNINGPSLIRVPDWTPNPMGKYYLYFAHHCGDRIRMAYSDRIEGPWKIHAPGALALARSYYDLHVASPDVIVREDRGEILMYYHGCVSNETKSQTTRLAVSADGVHFTAREPVLGGAYWRVFEWRGMFYALQPPGRLYRSMDGVSGWEAGPMLFPKPGRVAFNGEELPRRMRHCAVRAKKDELQVFYSNYGDNPERILMSAVGLSEPWMDWMASEPVEILASETEYEGASLPAQISRSGMASGPVRQLRDPAVFEERGKTYLLYSTAGECGIAAAMLEE